MRQSVLKLVSVLLHFCTNHKTLLVCACLMLSMMELNCFAGKSIWSNLFSVKFSMKKLSWSFLICFLFVSCSISFANLIKHQHIISSQFTIWKDKLLQKHWDESKEWFHLVCVCWEQERHRIDLWKIIRNEYISDAQKQQLFQN